MPRDVGKTAFALQFDASLLPCLAERYKASMPGEDKAFAAGRRIGRGDRSLENLRPVIDWKSQRSKGRVANNDARDVADALRLALEAETDRAAVSVLLGLRARPSADCVRHPDRNPSGTFHRHRLSRA